MRYATTTADRTIDAETTAAPEPAGIGTLGGSREHIAFLRGGV